jgi:hypothetical protein
MTKSRSRHLSRVAFAAPWLVEKRRNLAGSPHFIRGFLLICAAYFRVSIALSPRIARETGNMERLDVCEGQHLPALHFAVSRRPRGIYEWSPGRFHRPGRCGGRNDGSGPGVPPRNVYCARGNRHRARQFDHVRAISRVPVLLQRPDAGVWLLCASSILRASCKLRAVGRLLSTPGRLLPASRSHLSGALCVWLLRVIAKFQGCLCSSRLNRRCVRHHSRMCACCSCCRS